MTSVSLEEKRLRQLKQQLFGKELPALREIPDTKSQKPNIHQMQNDSKTTAIDLVPLRTDLFKIVFFSAAALFIQLILFFASKQGLINLFR